MRRDRKLLSLPGPRDDHDPAPILEPSESYYLRLLWRTSLNESSLLTREEVLEALPWQEREAEAWLAQQFTPLTQLGACPLYRWGAVLEKLHERSWPGSPPTSAASGTPSPANSRTWLTTEEVARRLEISRTTLDELVGQAPRTLPGAPISLGSGRRRHHWRWQEENVNAWLTAFLEWRDSQPLPPVPAPAQASVLAPASVRVHERPSGVARGSVRASARRLEAQSSENPPGTVPRPKRSLLAVVRSGKASGKKPR